MSLKYLRLSICSYILASLFFVLWNNSLISMWVSSVSRVIRLISIHKYFPLSSYSCITSGVLKNKIHKAAVDVLCFPFTDCEGVRACHHLSPGADPARGSQRTRLVCLIDSPYDFISAHILFFFFFSIKLYINHGNGVSLWSSPTLNSK